MSLSLYFILFLKENKAHTDKSRKWYVESSVTPTTTQSTNGHRIVKTPSTAKAETRTVE